MIGRGRTAVRSYWDMLEPVWESVSVQQGPAAFLGDFAKLSVPLGHLLAAHCCVTEVREGGLLQFFCDPAGVLAPEAAAGLEAIGLPAAAAAVEEAMAFFGPAYPRDRDLRCNALAAAEEIYDNGGPGPFDDLDGRLYELLDEEGGGFEKAADRYARQIG